ncbi:hypothetical protein O181_052380 [Austropuccinia psidii MF-1]|uniref:Uncharacterized protein n=1 Tax=Austropuccinia psidii MF-1 TaxID=1389203 RepID=A0A9Q3HSL3_9BASI|nr:hypothetical protein [Austropuccinia psidii MF-1]
MKGEAPSKRGGINSRRSRSSSCLLGGYPGIYQGRRSRLGEAEDEEGEEFVEEEYDYETVVEDSMEGAIEAPEAPNLAHSNQPPVLQYKPNFAKMMEQMTQLMGQITQAVFPRDNSRDQVFRLPP